MRSSVSAYVTTPQPSIAVDSESGSTSAAAATSASIASWHGCDGQPVALGRPLVARGRGAASPRACRSSCARAASARGRTRGRPRVAPAFVSRRSTGSSWSGRCRCDAHAIAISSSSRSGLRANERQRLDRLRRAAEERRELRISERRDDALRSPRPRHRRDVRPPRRLRASRRRSAAPRRSAYFRVVVSSGARPGRPTARLAVNNRGEIACTVHRRDDARAWSYSSARSSSRCSRMVSAGCGHIGAARLQEPQRTTPTPSSSTASRSRASARTRPRSRRSPTRTTTRLSGNPRRRTPRVRRDSVDYVVETLEAAGYDGRRSTSSILFQFPRRSCASSRRPAATHPAGAVVGTALRNGDSKPSLRRRHQPRRPPRANTSGCEEPSRAAVGAPLTLIRGPNDFAGFTAGNIALIQRGGCSFALKVAERPDRGRRRGHPLQPGQHARPQRPSWRRHGRAAGRSASRRSPSRWSARASPPARRSPLPARPRPSSVIETIRQTST